MRTVPEGYICDIYDGVFWKKFNSAEKNHFLCSPHCYLNIDWFEPFERGVCSTGVIHYSYWINSRAKRAQENRAWEHEITVLKGDNTSVYIKPVLCCVTCDIPAYCGFLSHNAALGCNKCLKKFKVTFGERTDYSSYNREDWAPRSLEQHRVDVNEVLKHTTKTAESQYGVRYSALLLLSYFDPIENTAIDAMHSLFLGTGKHVFSVWIEINTLTRQNLEDIEQRIKLFKIPNGIGRLPSQISSGYNSFTANQGYVCTLVLF